MVFTYVCFYRHDKILLFFLLLVGLTVKPFEVKVLLQKISKNDLRAHPIMIHSDHGFIISHHAGLSLGKIYKQKTISVQCNDQDIIVEDNLEKKSCFITSALSVKHQEKLRYLVTDWFDHNQDYLDEKSAFLQPFFDAFIDKKSMVEKKLYQDLHTYSYGICMSFCINLMQRFQEGESVISLNSLEQYLNSFLGSNVKDLFLSQLADQQISKKERRLLQQDIIFRYNFFKRQVHAMISLILQDFMVALPRNFIAQILHDEVGFLGWQGNNYAGSFALLQDADMAYVVNCLDVDDYLLSVIHHEGWPGWPLEMNKVLAITCRTYLVWQVLQAQKLNRIYHIENGIRHQTYKGHHKFVELKKAITETKDLCIAYDNKPILAMFDGCCGGVIPGLIAHPDYKKHPYLLRTTKCTFCKDFKVAHWQSVFNHDEMVAKLKKALPELTTISSMSVTAKDKAGLVSDVSVHTPSCVFHVTGKKMYSLFPEIKSFCFDIEMFPKKTMIKQKKNHKKMKKVISSVVCDHPKSFIVSGKGQGHHMGLCQWGAMKLVRDYDWKYQNVLQFYYPGTNLIKLTYQR